MELHDVLFQPIWWSRTSLFQQIWTMLLCCIFFFLRFYFSVYTVFTKHPPASWGSSSSYPIANSEVLPCSHSPLKKHSLLPPLRSQCWLCHKCSAPCKTSCFPIPCSISVTALTLLVTLISNPNMTWLRPHANSSSLFTSAWAVIFFLSTAKVHNPAPNTFCLDCSLSGLFNTKFPYSLFKQGTANKNKCSYPLTWYSPHFPLPVHPLLCEIQSSYHGSECSWELCSVSRQLWSVLKELKATDRHIPVLSSRQASMHYLTLLSPSTRATEICKVHSYMQQSEFISDAFS